MLSVRSIYIGYYQFVEHDSKHINIQSSLLSSLMINPIQDFTFDYNTCVLSYNSVVDMD